MPSKSPTFDEMSRIIQEKSKGNWELQPCTWQGKRSEYPCICKIDGPFKAQWASLRLGYGCKPCGRRNQLASVSNYTEAEDSYITANHHLSAEEIGKKLGRTPKGIAKRREKLPVPKKTRVDSGQTKIQTMEREGQERRKAFRGVVEDELFDYPASPSIAEQNKVRYYFTGEECPRGHVGARYTSNRQCVECCMEDSNARIGSEARKAYISDYQKRPDVAEKRRERNNRKYQEDVQYRLRIVTSNRITGGLKRAGADKILTTCEYIGTSFSKYREWLEQNWEEGMTWENNGKGDRTKTVRMWEQGHIRPISSFELQDEEQKLVAFNWRNVKPQWQDDNREDWYRYTKEDEEAWISRMRSLGFSGDLFLRYSEE